MPVHPSLAWVESPLQLLGVIEAHAAGFLGSTTRVFPRKGVPGLPATLAAVRDLELPTGLRLEGARAGSPAPSRHRTWVIGDPLSGRIQRQLVATGDGPIVLVDDGRATLHTLERLAGGLPLTRAKVAPSLARRVLGRATGDVLRSAAADGRLTVFSVYDLPGATRAPLAAGGVRFARHHFGWLRDAASESASVERGSPAGHVVLGSALVVDGLVDPGRYLSWVAAMAGSCDGPWTYWAHRREDRSTLTAVSALPGVDVRHDGLPVELGVCGMSAGGRISSLPTSALTTLHDVLAGRGIRIDDYPIPSGWWTAAAPADLRAHLGGATGASVQAA
jgi:hypothetical protein